MCIRQALSLFLLMSQSGRQILNFVIVVIYSPLSLVILVTIFMSSRISAEPSAGAKQLASHLANQSNFMSGFTQQAVNAEGDIVDRSLGNIVISRPFHLRWETISPYSQVIIINGDQFFQYDSDIDQLIVSSLDDQTTAIPTLLLKADASSIEKIFSVRKIDLNQDEPYEQNVDADGDNQTKREYTMLPIGTSFHLVPIASGSLITELTVNFHEDDIASIVIVDDFGMRSQFLFNEIIKNESVDMTLFELHPPADTDIIYR